MENKNKLPLCVDLDGTLIKGDILYESILLMIKHNILYIFIIPFWLLKGRLHLKNQLAKHVIPNCELLPYRKEILRFIESEKFKGRKIVLVTASLQTIANKVADYIILFDSVLGSDDKINLVAENKRDKLVELYGSKGFDYIGDSHKDIYIWKEAQNAIIVNPTKEMKNSLDNISNTFEDRANIWKLIFKEIRVYQWIKNLLIFLPLLLAHLINFDSIFKLFVAFISFSFTASSVYILNDMVDIESDREHPRKKNRPLASGNLPIIYSFIVAPLLFLSSVLISAIFVSYDFLLVMLTYFVITTLYSFVLKRLYVLDIITLSILYTIRLIAGSIAVDVEISKWFLSFSMFLFFSLAILKRYTELLLLKEQNKTFTMGRDYFVQDISLLSGLGTASGLISVLIFALYLNSPEVVLLYKNPDFLYLIIPILLYWITRIWFKAHRGQMHDDPIVFTGKDKVSYLIGFIIAILITGATLW